jgi:hypothetical protein
VISESVEPKKMLKKMDASDLARKLLLSGYLPAGRKPKEEGTTMKINNRLTIAAALLAAVSGVASAQVMKADIPFAFRAGNAMMAPGSYFVEVKGADRLVYFWNRNAGQRAFVLYASTENPARQWTAKGDPVMEFDCGASRCELTRLWPGYELPAVSVPHRSLGKGERPVLTLIRLVRASGE